MKQAIYRFVFSDLRRGSILLLPMALFLVILASCSGLKKSSTTTTPPKDTSKVEAVAAIDSVTNDISNTIGKVGDFLGSIIPGSLFGGGKDSIILIAPKQPEINPAVTLEPPSRTEYPTPQLERRLEFDSLGNVTVHDEFLGGDANIPQTLTVDQYNAQRQEQGVQEGLLKSAQNYTSTGGATTGTAAGGTASGDQGKGVLSDYNTVSIPIPPSIVPTIFGKPSINLQVNGDVAIHLAYRDNQFLQTTGTLLSGSETGLDFRQEVNMNIKGSIGDKVKINTDFGSLRQFNFDNIFNLSYKGYPDEIIQSVDAGNISLSTPSKYIGIQSGLFGFKGVMRFGPWYLTALAAQKKADRQTKTFGGGPGSSGGSDFVIQPANFRKNMYFLDTIYKPLFEKAYATIPRQALPDVIQQGSVEVWRSTNPTDIRKTSAFAYYDLPAAPTIPYPQSFWGVSSDQNLIEAGSVIKVDTSQFSIDYTTGVITLYQEPSDYDFIAVSYRTTDGKQYGDQIGTTTESIVLKLLKPKNLFVNSSKPSWNNLLKNSYYVGATNIDQKGFSVKIQYTFPSGQVYEYVRSAAGLDKSITATGLDRYENSSSAPRPDGLFDVISNGATSPLLNSRTGTLIFPYLEPFGKRMLDYFAEQKRKKAAYVPDSTFYFPEIYTQSPAFWQSSSGYSTPKNNEMSINVKYTGGTSTVINLNAFNIVEGSVRVTAGGRQLTEGTDYRVDINSGTITLLKPDLATAGQISVDYDTHDIFTTSTKTVVGLRAELPLGDRGLFGTTLMNYSMHLPTIKTRQGEEPLSNWILGGDLSYKVPTPFLTDWMNALPIFNLHDKSDINFKVDAALSMPNPNTQESPMAVDNGSSIAYLDDFEGGRTETPLSMNYGRWVHSSQPVFPDAPLAGKSTDEINERKSKMWWYQKRPLDVPIQDIKPNKSVASSSEFAQVLDVAFDPTPPFTSGIYNHNPNTTAPNEERWAGMMQYQQGLNVLATNTDAIEFWMNIPNNGNTPNGVLHFDMGRMSEDVIPDGHLETEDKNGNGRYDPGEDVGMDTLVDDSERVHFPTASNQGDPDNDNYNYTDGGAYDNINGTQGNENDPSSGYKPDTEDLDGDLSVNQDNSYYEYDVPLDPFNNPFVIGNTHNTWFQFRIPITSFSRMVGNIDSSFSDISYYRIWLSGFRERVQLRLYDIGLFGSQWTRSREGLNLNNPVGDTSFSVNYVNIEDNSGAPTNYTSPPGAERDKLAGQASVVLGNEQSISLQLKCVSNAPFRNRREAIRVFPSPNDLFNYRAMAIWVHGNDNMPTTIAPGDTSGKVWIYFRFGSSKYHYYEYKRPLTKDWQNIHIDFATLASLKATKRNYSDTVSIAANDGFEGSRYTVIGSPNITNAPVFTLGVENRSSDTCLQTDVWFDELRLLDANDKTDFALNGNMQIKLAEFGLVTTNFLYERPDFHRVDERFNSMRALSTGFSITGEFQMQKILPSWLERGTKFPLTLSHSESMLSPKYVPNTDVEVQGAIDKINEQANAGLISSETAKRMADSVKVTNETLTVRNSIGMTGVQFNFPGSFFLLPAFVNRLVYGFGYGEEFTRSPVYEYYRNWSWTASILYDLPQLPNLSVSPLTWVGSSTFDIGRYSNWKINFLPQHITLGSSFTRSRLHYLNRTSTLQFSPSFTPAESLLVLQSLVPFITRSDTATRSMAINWKLTENGLLSPTFDYSLYVVSNLTPLETTPVNNRSDNTYDSIYYYQRPFRSVLSDVFFKDGALVRPGKDFLSYQHLRITTNPRLPWLFWLDKYLRPIFTYTVDYRWYDAQAGVQNDRTGQWNNIISTGVEINLKEFGVDVFGPDGTVKAPQRGGPSRSQLRPDQAGNPTMVSPPGDNPEMGISNPRLHRVGDVPKQLPSQIVRDTIKPKQIVVNTYGDTLLHIPGVGTEGERGEADVNDTLLLPQAPPPQVVETPEEPPSDLGRDIAKALLQEPFTDWTGTKFNFTQTNFSLNGALQGGGPGISNFLTKGIISPERDDNGPSRAYQLGLITDPHGRLIINFKPQFPFIEFGVRHGLRQGTNLTGQSIDITDVFRQKNTFELQTTKPLWTGASISFNWKTEFTFDQRSNLRIADDGSITVLQVEKIGDVSRTFFSIPPIFGLSGGIGNVGKKWEEKTAAIGATTDAERDALDPATKNKIQVESFMQGFETLPFFAGALREYLPRLNYSFNWTGLEKFPLFSFSDRASFRHTYVGNYKRTFKLNPGDSLQLSTLQLVTYAFRPLAALDLNWDKIWGGRLTFSVNYDTQTDWASDYSFNRITSRLSTTFGVTANFQKAGLTIPFFKLNLKNNFGATFNFSQTISSDIYYTFNSILTDPDGTSNGGITKVTVEPRFSYDINQQLTIEGFYRYERTTPAEGVILAPPTRTITAGFDIRLKVF